MDRTFREVGSRCRSSQWVSRRRKWRCFVCPSVLACPVGVGVGVDEDTVTVGTKGAEGALMLLDVLVWPVWAKGDCSNYDPYVTGGFEVSVDVPCCFDPQT